MYPRVPGWSVQVSLTFPETPLAHGKRRGANAREYPDTWGFGAQNIDFKVEFKNDAVVLRTLTTRMEALLGGRW